MLTFWYDIIANCDVTKNDSLLLYVTIFVYSIYSYLRSNFDPYFMHRFLIRMNQSIQSLCIYQYSNPQYLLGVCSYLYQVISHIKAILTSHEVGLGNLKIILRNYISIYFTKITCVGHRKRTSWYGLVAKTTFSCR